MGIERIGNAPGTTYATAVAVSGGGRWVHASGCIGRDENGQLVPGGMGPETHAVFDRLEDALRSAGCTLGDVVKITAFLTDLDDYASYAEARGARFGDQLPASSAVKVAGLLGGAQVEIEAIAFLPD